MSFSDADVVHPADAPSSHRKLLCTLWCLLVSQTSLCEPAPQIVFLVRVVAHYSETDGSQVICSCSAEEKQERWRSSIRATGRTHEIRGQLLGGSLEEKTVPVPLIFQGGLPLFSDGGIAV